LSCRSPASACRRSAAASAGIRPALAVAGDDAAENAALLRDRLAGGHQRHGAVLAGGLAEHEFAAAHELVDALCDPVVRDALLAKVERGLDHVVDFERHLALAEDADGAGGRVLGAGGRGQHGEPGKAAIDERIVGTLQDVGELCRSVADRGADGQCTALDPAALAHLVARRAGDVIAIVAEGLASARQREQLATIAGIDLGIARALGDGAAAFGAGDAEFLGLGPDIGGALGKAGSASAVIRSPFGPMTSNAPCSPVTSVV
jgi:hypothetical protein